MNNVLPRIIASFLVPCLMADPASASAMGVGPRAVVMNAPPTVFTEQAIPAHLELSPRVSGPMGQFIRRLTYRMKNILRARRSNSLNVTFIDPTSIGLNMKHTQNAKQEIDQLHENMSVLLSHVLQVIPTSLGSHVLNVGSGFHPLVLHEPWKAVNLDYHVNAINISRRYEAIHWPMSLEQAKVTYEADQRIVRPSVILLYDRAGFIVKDPTSFWTSIWDLLPSGGWIIMMNPPQQSGGNLTTSVQAWYLELQSIVKIPRTSAMRVLSPDQTLEHATVIAVQKSDSGLRPAGRYLPQAA